MEKTISLFDIIRSAFKEWAGKKEQEIDDEKVISGEISDAEFTDIAQGLSSEDLAMLLKTRNGRGADKLENNDKVDKSFVKKVNTPSSNNKIKTEKVNRQNDEKDLNREI